MKEKSKGSRAPKKLITSVPSAEHDGNEKVNQREKWMFRSHSEACWREEDFQWNKSVFIFHAIEITFISSPDVGNSYTPLRIWGSSCQSLYFSLSIFLSDWGKYFIFYLSNCVEKLLLNSGLFSVKGKEVIALGFGQNKCFSFCLFNFRNLLLYPYCIKGKFSWYIDSI